MNEGPPSLKKTEPLLGGLTKAQFNKLRKEWYGRLKAEGFVDVEYVDSRGELQDNGHRDGLKFGYREEEPSRPWSVHPRPISNECAERLLSNHRGYYVRCAQFLHTSGSLPDEPFRTIWELHSDGLTVRDIAEQVNRNKDFVHKTIVRCRILMEAWWLDSAPERDDDIEERLREEDK